MEKCPKQFRLCLTSLGILYIDVKVTSRHECFGCAICMSSDGCQTLQMLVSLTAFNSDALPAIVVSAKVTHFHALYSMSYVVAYL